MSVDDHDILRGGIRFSPLAFDDLELVAEARSDSDLVQRAVQAGAIGYLVKGVSADELAEAIRATYAGRPVLGPEATQALSQRDDASPDDV